MLLVLRFLLAGKQHPNEDDYEREIRYPRTTLARSNHESQRQPPANARDVFVIVPTLGRLCGVEISDLKRWDVDEVCCCFTQIHRLEKHWEIELIHFLPGTELTAFIANNSNVRIIYNRSLVAFFTVRWT